MQGDDKDAGNRRVIGELSIDVTFFRFVEDELLPAIGFNSSEFWRGLEALIVDLTPRNRELLQIRDDMQEKIDDWHKSQGGSPWNHAEYAAFLKDIGYLQDSGEPFQITTAGVDPEIATIAGPQLVVPVGNARFALNAANARWGSLYDALYGTDVISEDGGQERGSSYNPTRGAAVIRYASDFLDRTVPLESGSHGDVSAYSIDKSSASAACIATMIDGSSSGFREPGKFVGYAAQGARRSYLFRNNELHVEVQTDPEHAVGKNAPGNVSDVVLESAITTIQDCEDSVAAVDAEDKVGVYRNWLGLMQGTLEASFDKGGREMTRQLNADRKFTAADGGELVLSGLSLMLVRNVGHLMTTDAILDKDGNEIFEGMLDAVVTSACVMANSRQTERLANSQSDNVYIVKPKMHGPDEAAFTNTLFGRVEELLGLGSNTLKVGVMDEERRTTVNLQECIRAVKDRLVFINTGFLDRTGDEIHTSMQAGPVLPKETIKAQPWINAYEDWNVDVGIRCGLPGRAQIGKGMWPKPDEMKQMMDTKQAHPEAGANCAWVPSPTAATLHAMHYHAVDVQQVQEALASRQLASLEDILTPPLGDPVSLDEKTIQDELNNNAQGILGYVVRWIDQGVGCSKVPDISDIGLMEDRATLRISSQHIANWLLHGITNKEQVMETFRRMARIVDEQNAGDPDYRRMSDDYDASIAFEAACDLVFKGCEQPNGYTEPLLHAYRRKLKAQ
ncbi:MAG: malate synthase G [Gammaproteobacteria bacterium]|nr:malate synthase G [Gammaproteobacteria bacterium]MDH3749166.1 malate synthase G [Gammaproteobacteria bacterium]MDH3806734.1 malate synthase G [Gammaproteobacteria bacterium]